MIEISASSSSSSVSDSQSHTDSSDSDEDSDGPKKKLNKAYEYLIWVDLLVCFIHIVYIHSSGNRLSWVPLFNIRLPRIILHLCAKESRSHRMRHREYTFRRISSVIYGPKAVMITWIGAQLHTCSPKNEVWKGDNCFWDY